MSGKYKVIYSIDKNLYTPGAPVIITEGGLVQDIKNGNMFCQFKLVNISNKTINSLVGEAVTNVTRSVGSIDGQVCVRDMELILNIFLDGFEHNKAQLVIKQIDFTDGSTWKPFPSDVWSSLPSAIPLEEYLSDTDLVREFRTHFQDAEYFPSEESDVWYCSCGALNSSDESACHICNRTLSAQKKYGVSELKNSVAKQKRLDAINKDAFEDAYKSVMMDKKSKRTRNMIYFLIAVAVITFIAFLIASDGTHYTTAI